MVIWLPTRREGGGCQERTANGHCPFIWSMVSHLYASRHRCVGGHWPGPRFNIKTSYHLILLVWATPMFKERRLVRRLSVNMGLPILVRRYLYIETGPWRRPTKHRIHDIESNCYRNSMAIPFDLLNSILVGHVPGHVCGTLSTKSCIAQWGTIIVILKVTN